MTPLSSALLVNLVGFTVGVALYGLIIVMVARHRRTSRFESVDRLLLVTAALGLLWNLGELYSFVHQDFDPSAASPWLGAIAFSALGFLPSVVVHSAQADVEGPHWLTYVSYALSTFAAVLHFFAAGTDGTVPSSLALQTLTVGAVALAGGLLVFNFRQTLEKKAVWATALLVFAVSALHLSGEREGRSWVIELLAHQASLPIALTILYQNYRFAFADLFLKRAISLILLGLTSFGLYTFAAVPLLALHENHEHDDPTAISTILTLWIVTALIYPLLYRLAVWLVDKVLLHRADYAGLQRDIAIDIERLDTIFDVLEGVRDRLASVLTAHTSEWYETVGATRALNNVRLSFAPDEARVFIPTAEMPFFEIRLADLFGGRRLLSDEMATLEAIALLTARRIDALRVTHERCEQEFREQEFAKLATEAQLSALRSQINPHFLFNSLTTIGYLIKADPDKAYDTLLRLTKLLRGVLNATDEFCTLGEEMRLIETYLEIERARFEDKLKVEIDVPDDLRDLSVPALILQPLVENAVKHGVSENKNGGTVRISASVHRTNGHSTLSLGVWDSGSGKNGSGAIKKAGVGLRNVEERLASHYGRNASLKFTRSNGSGTSVKIELQVPNG